jgi:hypothetical protein
MKLDLGNRLDDELRFGKRVSGGYRDPMGGVEQMEAYIYIKLGGKVMMEANNLIMDGVGMVQWQPGGGGMI